MSEFEAVLFDMDGVTVETAAIWRGLEESKVLPAAVVDDPPIEEIRALSVADAYDRLAELDGVELTVSAAEFASLYEQQAAEVYNDRATLMEGYVDLLTEIRADGRATGLVSASRRDWVEMVLDRFDLHDLYDVVISSSDFEGPSKPDPKTYLVAANRLDIQPHTCLVVEDSPHGIEAAVEAGMYCIALRGAGNTTNDLSTADRIVESAHELHSVLSEMGLIGAAQ